MTELDRPDQIGKITQAFKTMAKDLDCTVIELSQIKNDVNNQKDKRHSTSSFREAGAIEANADTIMLLYRDEYCNSATKEPGVAEINITKNRTGETATAKLAWMSEHMGFENLD